jgi:hypothetical protein
MKNETFLRLVEGSESNVVKLSQDSGSGPRRFQMQAYTGAMVSKYGVRMVFDLKGISKLSEKMPIFKDHDTQAIVGHSQSVTITPNGIDIQGKLSNKTAAAKEVMELSDEEFPWQASMGVQIDQYRRVGEKEKATVNGREVTGPCYVIEKATLRESSFVPLGADGSTSAVVLSIFDHEKSPAEGLGREDIKMSKENEKTPEVDAGKVQADAVKGERDRFAALAAKFPKHPEFVAAQFAAGASVEQADLAFKDVLLAERDAEIAKLKAAPAPAPVAAGAAGAAGVPPVGFSGGAAGDKGTEKKCFIQLAQEYGEQHKCGIEKAMNAVALTHAEAHAEFVDSARESKGRKIARNSNSK